MPLKLIPPKAGKTPFYYARGTVGGRRIDRSTGHTERRKAEQRLKQIEAEEQCRIAEPKGDGDTFGEALLSYIQADHDQRFLDPLLEYFGKTKLAAINQATIDAAATELYPKGSAGTRNRQVYTPVSAILRHAGVGILLRRPKGHAGIGRTRWLSPEQARLAAAACPARIKPLFLFLLYTGCRLSEALRMDWGDIDLGAGTAYIAITKNEDPRTVRLPPDLNTALANLPKRSGSVFRLAKGGRLYGLWKQLKEASGLSWLTPHVLRHTWATWMRLYGRLDGDALKRTRAWKDRKSVARYDHAILPQEAMAADLLPSVGKKTKA